MNEGVVSKETVVLRRWGSRIKKFGFINGVDNVNWPPYRDSLYGSQFTLSTPLIKPNFCMILKLFAVHGTTYAGKKICVVYHKSPVISVGMLMVRLF